jgi:hypothetical protein
VDHARVIGNYREAHLIGDRTQKKPGFASGFTDHWTLTTAV